MQRYSPAIFWLLLVATILVDAVVVTESSIGPTPRRASESVMILALGLAFGQLSAVCIWSIFARPSSRVRWLFPYLCATLAAILVGPPFSAPPHTAVLETIVGFALFFWLHVSLVIGCLWIAKQYRFSYAYATKGASAAWQVSMLHLFLLTTVVALTMGLYAKTTTFRGSEFVLIGFWCLNNAGLAAFGVMSRSFKSHITLRLAALVGITIGSCVVLHFSGLIDRMPPGDILKLLSAQIVQAVALFIWMECVPIVPTPDAAPGAIKHESASAASDVER
jgi:hypothetical protein